MKRVLALLLLLFGLLFGAGCDLGSEMGRLETRASVGRVAEVVLQLGDQGTFQSMLDRHRGSVVLVDFWATWCLPCTIQFPHTVERYQRYRGNGLAAISVSMNEPSDRDEVLAFLKRSDARFDNLLTQYGAGSAFVDAFDLRGDIPAYRLYDRRGKLRYTFCEDPEGVDNGEPIDRIDRRIEELLAEEAEPK